MNCDEGDGLKYLQYGRQTSRLNAEDIAYVFGNRRDLQLAQARSNQETDQEVGWNCAVIPVDARDANGIRKSRAADQARARKLCCSQAQCGRDASEVAAAQVKVFGAVHAFRPVTADCQYKGYVRAKDDDVQHAAVVLVPVQSIAYVVADIEAPVFHRAIETGLEHL